MLRLSLHHLTALDATPAELVACAQAAGCGLVSLFTYMPDAIRDRYPMVDSFAVDALADIMREARVNCHCLEVFPLSSETDWEGLEEGLRIGARLGASLATVHLHDSDPKVGAKLLFRLASAAEPLGIRLGLEFNPYSKCASLESALELVVRAADAGADVGIILDTLHAVRTGTTLEAIASAADRIVAVQLSDGPLEMPPKDRWSEAISGRMLPGEGAFPLAEMLSLVKSGIVIDVEVPQKALARSGIGPAERCRMALNASRLLLGERL